MKLPLEITFHDTKPSPAIERAIRDSAASLNRHLDHIVSCRVTISHLFQQTEKGEPDRVRIDIVVPGDEISITRDAGAMNGTRDLSTAVRDAFDTANRLLEDEEGQRRHNGKRSIRLPHGRVRLVMRDQNRGLLEGCDGREIFFHKNSLVNAALDTLTSGMDVVYIERRGQMGNEAAAVRVVGRECKV